MTTMTITTTSLEGQDPAYYAGRADAYDEHNAGVSLAELLVRSAYIGDLHPSGAYGLGYSAYIAGVRLEQAAATDVQSDHAHRKANRKARLAAKTVADAEATHCRRLGITQDAWDEATR